MPVDKKATDRNLYALANAPFPRVRVGLVIGTVRVRVRVSFSYL